MAGTSPAMARLLRLGLHLRSHRRLYDLVRVTHGLAALDLVDVFHALNHLAPDGVLVVEEARIVEANEKLAVARIRIAGARHRHRAAHGRLAVKLGLQLFARPASPRARRAAGLGQQPVDNAGDNDTTL